MSRVCVGGGNSFRLLRTFQRLELLDLVRERVVAGDLRYWGSSAGSNLACPTIRTTNDMPIVEPAGLACLGLIPFQVNPHYTDTDPNSTHMGENGRGSTYRCRNRNLRVKLSRVGARGGMSARGVPPVEPGPETVSRGRGLLRPSARD